MLMHSYNLECKLSKGLSEAAKSLSQHESKDFPTSFAKKNKHLGQIFKNARSKIIPVWHFFQWSKE